MSNVRIRGFKSQEVEISVEEVTILYEASSIIQRRLGLPSGSFLDKKGRLVEDDPHHRHGSISEVVLKEVPSEDDLLALSTVKTLEALIRRFNEEDHKKRV